METAVLRAGETIRQARREGRCGTSVERRNKAGVRPRATQRAGGFCVVGSSKGSPVVPLRASPFSCSRRKILSAQPFYKGESGSSVSLVSKFAKDADIGDFANFETRHEMKQGFSRDEC